MKHRYLFVATLLSMSVLAPAQSTEEQPDNYTWLEDVLGTRSMDWVKAHNEASTKVLEADPRFKTLWDEALKVAESPDRIPEPDFRNGTIYNAWDDKDHVRGILRRTTVTDYLKDKPNWHTVLDYDALGKLDKKSWVDGGLVSLYPNDRLALVGLSEGGEDARTYREFNLKLGKFVKDGFVLPRAKTDLDWLDENTLLVATDWGPGSMTESGYAYIVKVWKRGTPLASAKEIYRGKESDVAVGPSVIHDGQGHQLNLIGRSPSFFETEYYILTAKGPELIGLPKQVRLIGLLNNKLIFTINQDWTPTNSGASFVKGSVLGVDAGQMSKDPSHLKPTPIFVPSATEFYSRAGVTKNRLVLTSIENVHGRAYVYTPGKSWTRKKLPVPDFLTVSINSTNEADDRFFLSETGYLTPTSLFLGDARTGKLRLAKQRKPLFDASNLTVEQLWTTSKDGTRVPYFIVHRKDLKYDGNNPTLLYGYGGFLASETPFYSGNIGKLWLERGGVFVDANIRGGAEFGPAWHDAGLKTNRQRIYDDFYAVGQDLCSRKITSPRRLGIEGGSNGGLLMGVEMTQHPEMWNAVCIEVPLLDMLGFEHIAAGASWVGEYGSTKVPEERKFLASISPYNQLRRDVTYPEPYIFTTTRDDRVGPVHARKFAARMEEFGKPFLYMEIIEGGHGVGADLKQRAHSEAMTFTYLSQKLMD